MVSVDDLDTNTRFAKEHEADYPILSDANRQAAAAYGVLGNATPTARARRWTFYIGPDGKILYIDKAVRTAMAGEDMVARLTELGIKRR
jgi:thioredoxin-dependent peroxiredoxin